MSTPKHNVYFDGAVQSLGFRSPQGYATVGVIRPGTYRFTTDYAELTRVVSGELWVCPPGESWRRVAVGESFAVAAGIAFELRAEEDVAYLCHFEGAPVPTDAARSVTG